MIISKTYLASLLFIAFLWGFNYCDYDIKHNHGERSGKYLRKLLIKYNILPEDLQK